MITLSANTTTKIVTKENRERILNIISDSTTVTRLSMNKRILDEVAGTGFGITSSNGALYILLPAGQEIYAISTGTPDISVAECPFRPLNAVRLDTSA